MSLATADLPARPSTATIPDVTIINPLHYPSWDSMIAQHPASCFFHRKSWARVLNQTYGHTPVYFCRSSGAKLEQVLPVMEVSSPWKGRRGVSLPFSDFCEPLTSEDDPRDLYRTATAYGQRRGWKYFECRSPSCSWNHPRARQNDQKASVTFHGHVIDLASAEDKLLRQLEGSVKRGIRKAQSAGLQIEFADTLDSMRTFYRLHCITRKRQGVPPQPFRFFENIFRCVFAAEEGITAIARLGQRAIGAFVLFQHQRKALYKFGASDFRFQHLRPNNLLMWETMRHYARRGFTELHLGRTSLTNEGLRRFKLGFGAREEVIAYRKFDFATQTFVTDIDRAQTRLNKLFRRLPVPLLRLAGQMLYPHLS